MLLAKYFEKEKERTKNKKVQSEQRKVPRDKERFEEREVVKYGKTQC